MQTQAMITKSQDVPSQRAEHAGAVSVRGAQHPQRLVAD